jgi:signal transduction histidine kinase/CheY-like chemotaxis protein
MGISSGATQRAQYEQADLDEMRAQALKLVSSSLLVFVFVLLMLATIDSTLRRPTIWLIVAPVLIAALVGHLKAGDRHGTPFFMVALLGAAIVKVRYVYSDPQILYLLPLLVLMANPLLGEGPSIGIASALSLVIIVLGDHKSPLDTIHASGIALLLLWATTILAAIASRPIRVALAWAWRSYALAEARTEELRDRQAELARLAKSLAETCERLEDLNADLDRERRAAEQARRLKAEFAAAISHELRTPLNLIIGFAEMMISAPHAYSHQPLPEVYRQDLEAIYRNASHISRLIDDVLDLSQIDAHRLALEKSYISLEEIVHGAVLTVSSFYEHLGLSLTTEIPPNIPPLYVDAGRIRQILINLLNNAARFTERGGVTIRARLEDNNVIISVSDTGVGISPLDLPYIFDEFRQVGPPGRHHGGSGLGLAICKRFAEMHGGFMWAESRVGEGSTFYLSLPLGDPTVIMPTRIEPRLPLSSKQCVAVLGCDEEMFKIFERYLDDYRIVRSSSPAEIQRQLREEPLHAVILTSPHRFQPFEGVTRDDFLDLPVFTCTLKPRRTMRDDLGIVQYLVKPISRESLVSAIRRHVPRAKDILIVEDDQDLSRLFANFIRASFRKCRIRTASSGAEALVAVREKRPDVILLDLILPEIDGYGVLSDLKRNNSFNNIPVIVVSAMADEEIRAMSITISRSTGLSVGEMMRCLRYSLDALSEKPSDDTARALPAGLMQ